VKWCWSWSSLITAATLSSITASAVISAYWFADPRASSRFEPAVQMLGLAAGVTGLLAERRAAARERRLQAIASLVDEFRKSAAILDDPRFAHHTEASARPQVYPRLPVSATDSAMISGALAGRRDAKLLRHLYAWRDDVNGFNRRLDLTELRLFTAGLHGEIGEFERALHSDDGYLNELRRQVRELLAYLGGDHGRD
jgi:hypothetical protein